MIFVIVFRSELSLHSFQFTCFEIQLRNDCVYSSQFIVEKNCPESAGDCVSRRRVYSRKAIANGNRWLRVRGVIIRPMEIGEIIRISK